MAFVLDSGRQYRPVIAETDIDIVRQRVTANSACMFARNVILRNRLRAPVRVSYCARVRACAMHHI